jgi:hypothetical protein
MPCEIAIFQRYQSGIASLLALEATDPKIPSYRGFSPSRQNICQGMIRFALNLRCL